MSGNERPSPGETLRRFVALVSADESGPGDAAFRSAVELLEESGSLSDWIRREAADPGWATEEDAIHLALVLGRADVVEAYVDRLGEEAARRWVNTPGGPYAGRQPLHYVTYSKLHRLRPAIGPGLVECAERLLEIGADPDAAFPPDEFPETLLRPLYGACGVTNSPEMAALLLDRGAQIDDGESLYHSLEFDDLRCFELLLARGVAIDGTNALNHSLDLRDPTATRRLLEEGGDPNLQTEYNGAPIHWAITRGREIERLQLLFEAGADLRSRRLGDASTPYQVAAQTADLEAATWLEGKDAATPLEPFERFMLCCARSDESGVRAIRTEYPALFEDLGSWQLRAYLNLAERGRSAALAQVCAAGFPVGTANHAGQTALHWAAWHGHADSVRVLLEAEAPLDPVESEFGCTPLGWAAHGCANWPNPEGDYLGAARRLIEAGADLSMENNWGVGLIALAGSNEEMVALLRQAGATG